MKLCSHLTLILIFLLLSISCGKKMHTRPIGPSSLQMTSQEAKLLLQTDQISCEGICPEYVGAFYLSHSPVDHGNYVRTQLGLCSTTLIAPDRVLTNRHCIDDILKAGELCSEKASIEIKFPQSQGKPFRSYKCKKVLSASQELLKEEKASKKKLRRLYAPDWAVIELNEKVEGRSPVSARQMTELMEGASVELFPVYFQKVKDVTVGRIRQVRCQLTYNESVNIFALDQESALFSLKNCDSELRRGNSGSGLFTMQNELVGVLAVSNKKDGAGTMASCIPDLWSSKESACLFADDQTYFEIQKILSYFQRDVSEILEQARKDDFWKSWTQFRWDEEFYHFGQLKNLKLQFKGEWLKYFDYLQKNKKTKLAQQLESYLLRTFFIKVPRCIGSDKDLQFPLGNLESWDLKKIITWEEYVISKDGKQEPSKMEWSAEVRLKVDTVTLKSNGLRKFAIPQESLPEPLNSLEFELPLCPPT